MIQRSMKSQEAEAETEIAEKDQVRVNRRANLAIRIILVRVKRVRVDHKIVILRIPMTKMATVALGAPGAKAETITLKRKTSQAELG